MSTEPEPQAKPTGGLTPVWIILTRDLNMNYRGSRVLGGPGDLFEIADGERFKSEWQRGPSSALTAASAADPGFVILDDLTAQELLAERAKVIEAERRRARQKAREAEAAIQAEAERQAQRDALVALVREAALKDV